MWKLYLANIGKLSWLLYILFFLTLIYIITKEVDALSLSNEELELSKFYYYSHEPFYWLIAYISLIPAVFITLVRLTRLNSHWLQLQAWAGVFFIALFILATYYYSNRLEDHNGNVISILLAGITFGTAMIGWSVSFQWNGIHQKKTHTFNILQNSRLSETYQQQLDNMYASYPIGQYIPKADIAAYDNNTCNEKTLKAIRAACYLLNFYEFVASGIKHNDLDDGFLYQNIRGFVNGLIIKTEHLQKSSKYKDQPKAWRQLNELNCVWVERYKTDPEK
jgi:hypothetical protein